MRSYGLHQTIGTMVALAGAASLASPSIGPSVETNDRRDFHKPSGNKPVPGGGAKERARRAARLNATNKE